MNPLEQEIARRLRGLDDEVETAVRSWERERQLLWGRVSARLELLTGHLAMARHGRRPEPEVASTRARAEAALAWLDRFDRERQAMVRDLWGLLAAAADAERRRRDELDEQRRKLLGVKLELVRHAEAAVHDALAVPAAGSPGRPALREQYGGGVAGLRRDFERVCTTLEAQIERAAAVHQPDWETAAARLAGRLVERPGDEAPARAPATRRPPPSRPRQLAKIPRFLLSKFYRKGGLRARPDGLEITFVNPLAFCIIQGGDAVVVDDRPFPKEQTVIDNGEKRLTATSLSAASYMKFAKGAELKVHLSGLALPRGPHRFTFALEMRKLGWVNLEFKDES